MNEHRNIEDYHVTENKGLIIYFDDGSHTYLDEKLLYYIVSEILSKFYEEE